MNNFPVPVLADLQAGTPKEARKSTLTERKRSFRGGEFNLSGREVHALEQPRIQVMF